ncbi:MAG: DUF2189 domain-containing protein [Paracoccaceae bacterium]
MTDFHILSAGKSVDDHVEIRQIGVSDVFDALRQGYGDFILKPSHYIFVVMMFPVIGVVLFTWASGGNTFQLLFPLLTGFALIGPFAGLGLYEISRRLEMGADASWRNALGVFKSPAIPAILAVGALLVGIFLVWMVVAQGLYFWFYGGVHQNSINEFFLDVITSQRGWLLILVGNGIGFVFALTVLCTTVIAFPLLLDRDVGANSAIKASLRAVQVNPVPMLLWGIIVALGLFLGTLPGLAGLVFVLPVLGHSTWHIYRKVVVGSRPVEVLRPRPNPGLIPRVPRRQPVPQHQKM